LASADWEPQFGDYLYVSIHHATRSADGRHAVVPVGQGRDGGEAGISIIHRGLVVARAVTSSSDIHPALH